MCKRLKYIVSDIKAFKFERTGLIEFSSLENFGFLVFFLISKSLKKNYNLKALIFEEVKNSEFANKKKFKLRGF